MKDRIISISSYGLCLFSNEKLKEFLHERKVRAKNVLKYFQNDKGTYLQSIREGIWLPVLPIDSFKYILKNGSNEEMFDELWVKTNQNNGFNIEIGEDNSLWLVDKDLLLTWNSLSYEGSLTDYMAYQTLDGETLYNAFRFSLEKGKYSVTLSGYKRIKSLDYPNANAGYLFEFTKIEQFVDNFDPREDDKYVFKIR